MKLLPGTSGFSYREWKGPFYPEKLPAKQMLGYYSSQLPTVEVNNTFYRMPKPEVMARWAEEVPDHFVFVVKASQRITHRAKLVDAEEAVGYLWTTVGSLGPHLGPILFQLPPWFRKDLEVLRDFLAGLPDGLRAVFEFRHETWADPAVHTVLADHGAALCVADTEAAEAPAAIEPTAPFGYLRLRRPDYDTAALASWAERIAAQPWDQAFAFFKHEDQGAAPRMALALAEQFAAG
ncbi:MAG: DUF72 domain-containing protein [Planctomycetota bacterium]